MTALDLAAQWDGRPENPERDGWHWLAFEGAKTPWADHWDTDLQRWRRALNYEIQRYRYLGPCLLPDEHAALLARLRRAEEALTEAVEFASQDCHALTPAGEAMVQRWRAALEGRAE